MAETTTPRATHEDLDLLAHIEVTSTWALYRAGWVHQLEGEAVWRLTFRGRDVLQGRTP